MTYVLNACLALLISVGVVLGLDFAGYFAPHNDGVKIGIVDLEAVSIAAAKHVQTSSPGNKSMLDTYSEVIEHESRRLAQEGYVIVPRSVVLAVPPSYQHEVTDRYIQAINAAAVRR